MNVQSNPKQLKWTHVNPELVQVILLSFAVGDASPRYAAATKSLQSCLTLCDPIDGLLPGSSVPGILQARTLEWVAIAFSNAWKGKVKVKSLSCVQLLATSWPAAHQAPPSMGSSRQEYWSGLPLPSPWLFYDLVNLGKEVLWVFSKRYLTKEQCSRLRLLLPYMMALVFNLYFVPTFLWDAIHWYRW